MSAYLSPLSPGRRRSHRYSRVVAPGAAPAAGPNAALLVVLWLLAALLAAFTLRQAIEPQNEGLMLQAGARIASGQWPYRDFWMNYPPGQGVLLAVLDKLFGVNLLSWRIVRVLVDATIAVLAYALVRRHAPERYALAAWVAVAAVMAFPSDPGPNPTALMLSLAALLLSDRAPRSAGALAGLAIFFRLEIGAAAALGVFLTAPPGRRAGSLTAAAVVAILTLGPFLAVAPHAMWSDTVGFFGIQHLQRLPLPLSFHGPWRPSKLIEFYIPLILLAGTALWAVSAVGGVARATPEITLALTPLLVVGVGYLLGRTDEFHLVPLAVVLPALLAVAAGAERREPLRIALLLALTLIAVYGLERRAGQALHPPAQAAVPGPAGAGVHTTPADAAALRGLLAGVDRRTVPGEPIFVADPRHDIVRVGDPLLYVILDHPNATRYDVMQPGVVTTAPVQLEITRALQRVRVVVRWLDPTASASEPNGAGRSSGVHILDAYLAAHYRQVARFGDYAVLERAP